MVTKLDLMDGLSRADLSDRQILSWVLALLERTCNISVIPSVNNSCLDYMNL